MTTHLHDEINLLWRLPAIKQRHDVFMTQFCEFQKYRNFLAEHILKTRLVILRDALDGDGSVSLCIKEKSLVNKVNFSSLLM
jgi:hypothetical protein